MALEQDRPIPFVCHMGFSCVTVPALPDEGFLATFGPYCPLAADDSLRADVAGGLANLTEQAVAELPFTLDDIHRTPAEAPPEMAAWLQELLRAAWAKARSEEAPPEMVPEAAPVKQRRPAETAARDPHLLRGVEQAAAALAGGDFDRVRAWLETTCAESGGQVSLRKGVRGQRVFTAVSAMLEAVEGAGLSTATTTTALSELAAVRTEASPGALQEAAMELLRRQYRAWLRTATPSLGYTAINRLVRDSLSREITLEAVARELGETPSAISHRMRRKFGMSFSEYISRMRTAKAKELLRRTRLPASEIGRRVGVRDASNFRKLFKKYEGMTPGTYRKHFGKGS
jgi:AraC-like DNA-binding protein